MSPSAVRAVLHRLLDELPDEELPAVHRFLGFLRSLVPSTTASEGAFESVPASQLDRESVERRELFRATGEFVADEDVRSWLASWGKVNELPPPKSRRLEK